MRLFLIFFNRLFLREKSGNWLLKKYSVRVVVREEEEEDVDGKRENVEDLQVQVSGEMLGWNCKET